MKKILVINFFPAFYPPTSGGELRYFNMYDKLSKFYDVTLLSPTYWEHSYELVEFSKSFREHRIPKADIFNTLHYEIDKENICSEISAIVCAKSSEYLNNYHYKYLELYNECDIIIHESPYMLKYDLFFGFDNKLRIYNSYNCETDLMKQLFVGENSDKYYKFLFKLEEELVLHSDIIFATCEEDRQKFIKKFGAEKSKIKLAPNGINPDDYKYGNADKREKQVFFIGSSHPPNIEAAEFIIDELAGKCKNIQFKIAGACCGSLNSKGKSNIHLLGKVSQAEKESLFRESLIAINPMFAGSGTNLKTLEFFSAGLPLISTDVGVRGINVEAGQHYILSDKSDFADKLNSIIENGTILDKIGKSGQKQINSLYSWESIAATVRTEIEALDEKAGKPVLFVLNDYRVSSPSAGGEIRINRLYSNLSHYYKIILVCLNDDDKIYLTNICNNFIEVSVPKTKEHIKEQYKINDKYWVSATDIVNSYMCVKNDFLKNFVETGIVICDIIILTHPFMANLIGEFQGKPIIYESHNIETLLKQSILKGHPDYDMLCRKCEEVEKKAIDTAQLIISCSHDDNACLGEIKTNDIKIYTIENGVDIVLKSKQFNADKIKERFSGYKTVVFIGSGHIPNVEGAKFIVEKLAVKLKNFYFLIIGSVCDALSNQSIPDNVILFGRLDDDVKRAVMQLSDIAINPINSGSGSNLKLADYFVNKIPAVTTKFGARGYNIKDNNEAVICDLDDFEQKIRELGNDEALCKTILTNAYTYVLAHLDWRNLGRRYSDIIDKEIIKSNKKRLLVVTYRINAPERGGAEVYLSNILKHMMKCDGYQIDVAALNIGNITNKYHFSIDFDYDNSIYDQKYSDLMIYKFNINDADEFVSYSNSKELLENLMEEFRQTSVKFLQYYDNPILLGGWYYPETADGNTQVWSSCKAYIYVKKIKSLKINGYSPTKQSLIVKLNNDVSKNVDGNFEISLDNIQNDIIELISKPFVCQGDVRTLGIRITKITYKLEDSAEEHILPLSIDYKDFLKSNHINDYIDLMIETAVNREKKFDDLFIETRGPLSDELNLWLDRCVKNYDMVLAHNTPFSTTITASMYAKKYNVPYAVLPHYHFDDEFYHWNSYYDVIKEADISFLAPYVSKQLFFDKISVKNPAYLPGGGIDADEYSFINADYFKNIYNDNIPFVLVLGRKSGAKNYMDIVQAVEKVNRKERKLNLVMIGIDEDKLDLSNRDVIYLGKQDREVVLGAISECAAVVTMSESESFGIVILEAWALKKPVIVNKHCFAFTELVKDGETGLLATKDNLHEKISYILANSKRARKIGRTGFEELGDKYTWKAIAFEMISLINQSLIKE